MGQLKITGKHTQTHTHPYHRVLDCQTLTIILIKLRQIQADTHLNEK